MLICYLYIFFNETSLCVFCPFSGWNWMVWLLLFSPLVMSDTFATPWTVVHQAFCPWAFPGKITGVGCHLLLQGIFLTQRSNPNLHLLHWQSDSLPLENKGSPCFDYFATEFWEFINLCIHISIYFLDTSTLPEMWFANILSQSVACRFILLTECFSKQKHLILMIYNLSNFYRSQFYCQV